MSDQYPSLYQIKCPFCGSDQYVPLGKKSSALQQFSTGLAAGLAPRTATTIANRHAGNMSDAIPLQYQCTQCKKKYEFTPLPANEDEVLDQCCDIRFERAKMLRGSAGVYTVYLNGIPIGNLGNGESFTFQTMLKYNTVFVGFGNGIVFRELIKFQAVPGGHVGIVFDGKFRFGP